MGGSSSSVSATLSGYAKEQIAKEQAQAYNMANMGQAYQGQLASQANMDTSNLWDLYGSINSQIQNNGTLQNILSGSERDVANNPIYQNALAAMTSEAQKLMGKGMSDMSTNFGVNGLGPNSSTYTNAQSKVIGDATSRLSNQQAMALADWMKLADTNYTNAWQTQQNANNQLGQLQQLDQQAQSQSFQNLLNAYNLNQNYQQGAMGGLQSAANQAAQEVTQTTTSKSGWGSILGGFLGGVAGGLGGSIGSNLFKNP